jgi:predicted DNA-binding protein with PD1-like motif
MNDHRRRPAQNFHMHTLSLVLGFLLAPAVAGAQEPAMTTPPPTVTGLRAVAFRLYPGDDLRVRLEQLTAEHHLQAAYVATAVGSVDGVALRFADQPEATRIPGRHEIVSLVGTLGGDGAHLHLAVADATGATRGGHLSEGTRVYTTAEIVVVELPGIRFERTLDAATGYRELRVVPSGTP